MKTASQLPAASPVTGEENIWTDQGGMTVRVTPNQLNDYLLERLAAAGLRLSADSQLQLKNPTTGKWHTLTVSGADGKAALAVSASGQN